jgi:hypothetical protein
VGGELGKGVTLTLESGEKSARAPDPSGDRKRYSGIGSKFLEVGIVKGPTVTEKDVDSC